MELWVGTIRLLLGTVAEGSLIYCLEENGYVHRCISLKEITGELVDVF